MPSKKHLALVVLALALTALLATAGVAYAEPADTSKIGQNLGNEVKSWAKALLLGVACLVGLPALAKRDLSQSLVIATIVIVLGGFIFAGGTVTRVIESLWNTIGG